MCFVISHTKTYSEYPEIAYWMDARKLYKDLDNSSTYRNSNDTLLAFYDSLNTAIIEHINATETNIANLIQSMNSQNYELYLQRLEEANSSNSNVVSEEDQENNEHDINDIYIKMIMYGLDSLNDEDSSRIVEIASLCPYIGGTAVYKARSLYTMYNPASMFDDIAICNQIGVYKNGNSGNNSKGIFDAEKAFLQSLKPNQRKNMLENNDLLLYPNPISSQLNIKYQNASDSKLQIADILGTVLFEIDLAKEVHEVSVNVSSLKAGVYFYRQIQNRTIIKAGKLLIAN